MWVEPGHGAVDGKGGCRVAEDGGIACAKCGAAMRCGYLVERDPFEIVPAGLGFHWVPSRGALSVFKTVALKAFACPECGYVEQYVKDVEKDREKILLGPVDATGW